MKITIAASVVLIVAVLKLVPALQAAPASLVTSAVLVAAGLYLVAQGFTLRRGEDAQAQLFAQAKAAEEKTRQLEGELKSRSADRPEFVNAEIINFLSLLQRKGRFVDFLMDDIARYDDKQVGAAARVVHQGCAEVMKEYFQIVPVRNDAEGVAVTLERGFNPAQERLVGKVVGEPPFRGVVLHRGWKTTRITLPRVTSVTETPALREIIAPAEIELT